MVLTLALIILTIANIMVSAQQQRYHQLFTIHIQITNASYIYYDNAEELTIQQTEVLKLVNVSYVGNGISNAWLYIQRPNGQYIAMLHVVSNGVPHADSRAIVLTPGNYYVSILVQPSTVVHYGENATITLYFTSMSG